MLTGKKFSLLLSLSLLSITVFAVSYQSSYALEDTSDVQSLINSESQIDESNVANLIQSSNVKIPFIQNQGQVSEDVGFYAKTFAGSVYVGDGGLTYSLTKTADDDSTQGLMIQEKFLTMQNIQPEGLEDSETIINYFVGKQEDWRTNVPTYDSISLGEVWPSVNVELKAYGNNFEKIFKVAPGASVDSIRIGFVGVNNLAADDNGELQVETALGTISMSKPIAYQEINGERISVGVSYFVDGNSYGFEVEDYDSRYVLVIDPLLAATYLGANGTDEGAALIRTGTDRVYVAGRVISTPAFPGPNGAFITYGTPFDTTPNGDFDGFVTQLSDDMSSVVVSTFLGGGSDDFITDIGVRSIGDGDELPILVTGYTESSDFPTTGTPLSSTRSGTSDAFVAILGEDLNSLIASTYLGGTGDEQGLGVASDFIPEGGPVYVTGFTESGTGFPSTLCASSPFVDATIGGRDIFIASLDSDLSTVCSSVFGGANVDEALAIALGPTTGSNSLYLTGRTLSDTDFPVTPGGGGAIDQTHNGSFDEAFLAIMPRDLTSLDSTYLGGTGGAIGNDIVYNSGTGEIYITGKAGIGLPTTAGVIGTVFSGGNGDAFISKYGDALGVTSLVASTYVSAPGGNTDAEAFGMTLNSAGSSVYITGSTDENGYPTTAGAFDTSHNNIQPGTDAFVSKLSSDFISLQASTFYGGHAQDLGNDIILGVGGGPVIFTGFTGSGIFGPLPTFPANPTPATPVTGTSFDTIYGFNGDAFVAILDSDLTVGPVAPVLLTAVTETETENITTLDIGTDQYKVVLTWSDSTAGLGTSWDVLDRGGVIGTVSYPDIEEFTHATLPTDPVNVRCYTVQRTAPTVSPQSNVLCTTPQPEFPDIAGSFVTGIEQTDAGELTLTWTQREHVLDNDFPESFDVEQTSGPAPADPLEVCNPLAEENPSSCNLTFDSIANVDNDYSGAALNCTLQPSSVDKVLCTHTVTGLTNGDRYCYEISQNWSGQAPFDSDAVCIEIDNSPFSPTILSIDSTTISGLYGIGTIINIDVTFDQAVTVTGTPTLSLNNGGITLSPSGSGTAILTFPYTVLVGEDTALLNVASLNAAAGEITSAGLVDADTTLPTGANLADNKSIEIDATPPTVSVVVDTTPTNSNPTYTATFSEDVTGFVPGGVTVDTANADVLSVTGGPQVYTITVDPTAADPLSEDVTISIGAGVAQDAATNDNTAAPTAATALYDSTPPVLTRDYDTAIDGDNGWHISQPIDIVWTCSDNVLGSQPDPDTVPDTPEVTVENGPGVTHSGLTCDDFSGRTSAAAADITIKVDLMDPVLTGFPDIVPADSEADTPDGDNGWYVSSVFFDYDCTDTVTGSGVDTFTADQTFDEGPTQDPDATCSDFSGRSDALDLTDVSIDLNDPTGTIVINGPTQPTVDGTTNPAVTLHVTCNDTALGSQCASRDLSGDIRGTLPIAETQGEGTEPSAQTLIEERGNKDVNAVYTDVSGRTSTLATDSTELVAVVTITGTDNDAPIWDFDTTVTSGTVTQSIQGATDGIKVNFQDGQGDFLISDVECNAAEPTLVCTWSCADDDICSWSIDHQWSSISEGGNNHVVNARLVDSDTLPAADIADFIEVNTPTGNGIVDADAPDTVVVQPHTLTFAQTNIDDLGRDADTNNLSFPWGSTFLIEYSVDDPNAVTPSPSGSAITVGGQTVEHSGTVLETLFGLTNTDTIDGTDQATGTVSTELKADGPEDVSLSPVETLMVEIDTTSVDFIGSLERTDLAILIHETDKTFDPITSIVAGQFFAVSGLVEDLDFFDDRHDGVLGASLSDESVKYFDNGNSVALGVAPDDLTTTDLEGILVEGAVAIQDFETKDGTTVLRTDRAIFLPVGAKLTLPPGVDQVILHAQNVIFTNQKATLSATTTSGTLVENIKGSHNPSSTPIKFAKPEFQSFGDDIQVIEVTSLSGSLSGASPAGIALTKIILKNSNHDPPTLFSETMDGMTVSTTPTEKGFVLDGNGFTIFPGIFFDTAKSDSEPLVDLQISAFFTDFTLPGGWMPGDLAPPAVGTSFFKGSDPAQNYTITSASLGFGGTVNINADEDKGFVSYGCISDVDEDGLCDGVEGATDQIEYDVGTDTKGTAGTGDDTDDATLFLPLPKGVDYCEPGTPNPSPTDFPDMTEVISLQIKDVFVEMDWTGGAHDPADEKRTGSGNLKVNGPQNLCDLITAFDGSPALNNLGEEKGIRLRIIDNDGQSEDVTAGGHLDSLAVWTDKNKNLNDDFNTIKLQYLGNPALRPTLGGTTIITDPAAAPASGAADSIEISGLTVASPPGTSGEATKGEIRVQVHLTLMDSGQDLFRGTTSTFAISHVSGGAAVNDFEVLVDEITATVDSDVSLGIEILNVVIPYEVRNDSGAGVDGTYSIGTITIPFNTGTSSVNSAPVIGWNSPVTVSTKMEAYSQFVHYGLITHSIGDCGPTGTAEQGQNDFVVALGCKYGIYESFFTGLDSFDSNGNKRSVGLNDEFTGTVMHELGHNFGLKHGGPETIKYVLNYGAGASATSTDPFDGDEAIDKDTNRRWFEVAAPFSNPNSGINCKPNYVSIMSYARQIPHTLKGTDYDLDFSSGHVAGKRGDDFRTLKEGGLKESDGVAADTWFDDKVPLIVWGQPQKKLGTTYAAPGLDHSGTAPVDWNDDTIINTEKQRENINSLSGVDGCGNAGTMFDDWNDWWNLNLDFAGDGGNTFDGVIISDVNDGNAGDGDGAASGNEWYDGLLYFNTLNPGGDPETDNVGPSGSRIDFSLQLLTCNPNNDPSLTDFCIDTGLIVQRAFFYQDPDNAREDPPAICIGNDPIADPDGDPVGSGNNPDDNDFNRPDCIAAGFVELKAINGQDIKPFARECVDSSCDALTSTLAQFTDDGAFITNPLGDGFHQHDNDDGVYHFSLLTAEMEEAFGTIAGKSFAFNFDRQSGNPVFQGVLFDLNDDSSIPTDYIQYADGDQVTVIISIPGGP